MRTAAQQMAEKGAIEKVFLDLKEDTWWMLNKTHYKTPKKSLFYLH